MKKRIKILTRGPIYEKGGMMGPITTPYLEDERTIVRMLTSGKKVNEVLDDGIEVSLDLTNYNTDNSNQQPVVNATPETPNDKVCIGGNCTIGVDVGESTDTTVTVIEEVPTAVEPLSESIVEEIPVVKEPVEVLEEVIPPVVEEPLSESIVENNVVEEDTTENSDDDGKDNDDDDNNPFKRIKKKKNR